MKYVTLATAKKHLYIEEEYKEDDSIITLYVDAAEIAVANHIRRELKTLEDEKGEIPGPILSAILLVTGGLFRDREVNFVSERAKDKVGLLDYLLQPYIDYSK